MSTIFKKSLITFSFKAYYEGSEWLSVSDWTGDLLYTGENDNCTSPNKLFEYIVAKPSDLLRRAYFYYLKGDRTKVNPDLKNGLISQLDHEWYGRCFTIRPTQDMIRRGIKAIVIYSKVIKSYVPAVYFHEPGAFTWQSYQAPQQWMQGQKGRKQEFYCEFEIHNRIPSKNACSLDKNFHTDLHAHLEIGNATLARFGCTTPFGPNKQTICINKTIGQEAIKFYREMWQSTHRTQSCTQFVLRPMFIRETFSTKKTYVSLKVNFVPYVKITDEQLSYTFLSLLAEIGGYVGLFLGVSVNQISNLAETALNRFKIG